MKPFAPPLPNEPVALAFTHLSNGQVIPFTDVECDRVRSSLRSAHAEPGNMGDVLFGRALGRVLAHELHHIIDQTRAQPLRHHAEIIVPARFNRRSHLTPPAATSPGQFKIRYPPAKTKSMF